MINRRSPDYAFAENILLQVSRTFALNINVLSGILHQSVLFAYLFLRIADTIEDDPDLPATEKEKLLKYFSSIFESPDIDFNRVDLFLSKFPLGWLKSEDPNHLLCRQTGVIINLWKELPLGNKKIIQKVILEMCQGMAKFALRQEQQLAMGWFTLKKVSDLDEYCYYVAGIVGKMLSQLFFIDSRFIDSQAFEDLKKWDVSFGLALQVTNIIKDVREDATRKVCFIPEEIAWRHGLKHSYDIFEPNVDPEARAAIIKELIDKAWSHLDDSVRYVLRLPRLERRIRLFCLWPLFMAAENLRLIGDGYIIFESENKAKISRDLVKNIIKGTSFHFYSNRWIEKEYSRLRP